MGGIADQERALLPEAVGKLRGEREGAGALDLRPEIRDSGAECDLAQRLADQDLLCPGVTSQEAADVLWLLSSFDTFDVLYTGRGLLAEAIDGLLTTMLERSLYR